MSERACALRPAPCHTFLPLINRLGREPMRVDYEVGFDGEGVVSALRLGIYATSGRIAEWGDLNMGVLWADSACVSLACRGWGRGRSGP